MSAELRELRGRVAAQERVMASLSVGIEEVTDQLQETTATMATKEDIKQFSDSVDSRFQQVDARFNQVDARLKQFSDSVDSRFQQVDARFNQVDARLKQFSDSVDSRFGHVYGVLADIQANVGEMRNILATLVGRLEQK